MTNPARQKNPEKSFYLWQNKVIHKARNALCMDLDDCRELARQISGKPSISSLNIGQRWQLIEMLKSKGANAYNPPLSKIANSQASINDSGARGAYESPQDIYPLRLAYWEKRFPKPRPGFADNKQLAWIEALWILDFSDGRAGKGLRGFIYRQTRNLEQGPVSDLAFLRSNHVDAVLLPLKEKARKKLRQKNK